MSNTVYSVGTVTVTNGGTTVTGSGTRWIGVVFEGDLFTDPAQGLFARVTADATDDDSLSINPWPGTALSDDAYEVLFASDAVRQSERTRQLLEQLSVVQANGRGLFMVFDDGTTDADPGAGNVRLNNATIGSATAAYIDNLDANGATVSGILDSWDDQGTASARGQLWLRSVADPAAFHAFKVTDGVVDGTGYRKLMLVYVGGSGSFAAGDELMVMFSPQGADGSNAVLGVWQGAWQTATDYDDAPDPDLVRFDGSTYICTEAHTSGTFATDLAAGKWELAVEKGDTGATGATGATGDTGPTGPGFDHKGAYSGGTAYVADDVVTYQGSSWIALGATTGNAPPSLPTTSNTWWELFAQKGADGAGTIASIVGGTGIDVDVTDPANPVVSVDLLDEDDMASNSATQPPTQQSVKAYVDTAVAGVDLSPVESQIDEVELVVSQLMLKLADIENAPEFMGPAGNWVADSFDTLTYVDTANATNLDTSQAGVLKPTTTSPSNITSGSNIGDMTGNGGLAAAFDGTTSQTHTSCARANASSGFIGKNLGSAAAIGSVVVFPSSNFGFSLVAPGSTDDPINLTFTVYGKSSAPANATDGTVIGSATYADGTASRTISCAGTYQYVWIRIAGSGGTPSDIYVAEMQIFGTASTANLTVPLGMLPASVAPTRMKALLLVEEVDAATAGTDYQLRTSRNGKTNWTSATLTEKGSAGGSLIWVETNEIDVSGQPSGTSIYGEFKTLNGKMVKLHGWKLYWGN